MNQIKDDYSNTTTSIPITQPSIYSVHQHGTVRLTAATVRLAILHVNDQTCGLGATVLRTLSILVLRAIPIPFSRLTEYQNAPVTQSTQPFPANLQHLRQSDVATCVSIIAGSADLFRHQSILIVSRCNVFVAVYHYIRAQLQHSFS